MIRTDDTQKEVGFIKTKHNGTMANIDHIMTKENGQMVKIFEQGFTREQEATALPMETNTKTIGKDLKQYQIYGNSEQRNLPKEYQEVEYIESSGTQYIDTGVSIKSINYLKAHLFFTGRKGDYAYGGDSSNNSFACWGTSTNTRFAVKSSATATFSVTPNDAIIEITESKVKLNDDEQSISMRTSSLNDTLKLFAGKDATYKSQLRCYYFILGSTNGVIRNLIPCYRKSDNEIGMYDTVNGVFYTNQGTGTFLKGTDAVPTPDKPIEIESVGDRTKNLFNKEWESYKAYIFFNNQYWAWAYAADSTSWRIPCKPNTDYTISCSETAVIFRIATINSEDEPSTTGTHLPVTSKYHGSSPLSQTITTGADDKYIIIQISTTTASIVKSAIQVEEGTTATPYEPYGYKIPVEVKSKNLFDERNFINPNWTYDNTEKAYTGLCSRISYKSGNPFIYDFKPNTQYTISLTSKYTETNEGIVVFITYTDTTKSRCNCYTTNIGTYESFEFTSEANKTISNIYFSYSTESTAYIKNFQLEEGTTATSYVPYFNETTTIYLNEPLRKIGE